jgi:hypothetical protein
MLGLLVLSMTIATSYADESAEVVVAEGNVTVTDGLGKDKRAVHSKSTFPTGSILSTGSDARAVVRVGTDGFIVLGKSSQIEIGKSKEQIGFFRQITGIIYYALNLIKGNRRAIEVRTTTTTIGIRGTRFIVTDTDENKEIGMRKGVVSVSSPEGEFEIHKKALQDEFEALKQEGDVALARQQREFADYSANSQKEFIEYKRDFSLEANRMASFDGKRVDERPLSGETKINMESFESYATEWLKQVHD